MTAAFLLFAADERGAITVDWIVMSAACVSMALAALVIVSGTLRGTGFEAAGMMSNYEIDHEFDTEAEINALQQAAHEAAGALN